MTTGGAKYARLSAIDGWSQGQERTFQAHQGTFLTISKADSETPFCRSVFEHMDNVL
jgi:hypothetical protein